MAEAETLNDSSGVEVEENEDDNVITLDEFIAEEQRLETDANALLGPSDDKNCTYNQGYMKRQALYACKTCKEESGQPAGICVACSYHCHEGHDLIELYTKRNFRCDCGNSRFKGKKCNLEPKKEAENVKNSYNQNFEGTYCICKRPYPDPEDSVADEMIQCIGCEDWYHTRHLSCETLPSDESYAEMMCKDCTEKLTFLQYYGGYAVNKVAQESAGKVDVCGEVSKKDNIEKPVSGNNEKTNCNFSDKVNGDANSENICDLNDKINCDNEVESSSRQHIGDQNKLKGCILETTKPIPWKIKCATFWPNNFRTLLCSCDTCKDTYSKLEASWLIKEGDTVQSYEEKGKKDEVGANTSIEYVLNMLSNMGMDRFTQAEAILNYNDLKTNLMLYLSKFAENKKVVREEDIHEFFSQMKTRKRQKLDQPYMCR